MSGGRPRTISGRVAGALGATLVFAVLTPWVLRPWFLAADALPRAAGVAGGLIDADLYLNVWIPAWLAHAVVHDPRHLFDGNVLHPGARVVIGSENMLSHLPVTVPALALAGNALHAFKALVFESFVLTGLGMFLYVRHHTGDAAAALVAGAALTFAPWRVQGAGVPQPQYLALQYVPLALLAIDCWIERGRWRAAAGLGGALALQALSGVYVGFFTFATVPVYALVQLLRRPFTAREWSGLLLGALGGAVATAPAALPYLEGRASGVLNSYPYTLLAAVSATPATFFSPALVVTAGPVVLGLLLLALWPSRHGGVPPVPWPAVLAFTGVAAILSMGPTLRVGSVALPLPYRLLYTMVPGFQTARTPLRCLLLVGLGLTILAGFLFARTAGRWPTARRWGLASVLVLAAAVVAGPTPREVIAARLGAATPWYHARLAADPTPGAVLELPAWQTPARLVSDLRNGRYMMASTTHWRPTLNGWTAHEPATVPLVADVVRRLPEPDALQLLVDLVDVRWIVLHRRELLGPDPARWATPPSGLRLVEARDGDELYEVMTPPAHAWREAFLTRAATAQPDTFEATATSPLPAACRHGELSVGLPAVTAGAFIPMPIDVTVTNPTTCAWPALGARPDGLVTLAFRWTAPDGATSPEWLRTRLLHDVAAGAVIRNPLQLQSPSGQRGSWTLTVQLEQDGLAEPLARATATTHVGPSPDTAGPR